VPKGPKGENRPADVIGCAVLIGRIATGDIADNKTSDVRMRRASAGGIARAQKTPGETRSKIAKNAALARWK
jgi:hypothetical protein